MDNLEQHREDWEEDISLADAMKEVQRAKARINTKKRMADFAKALDARTQVERWRKMYEFLANYNAAARRDIDLFNADCQRIKQDQKNWNATGKHIQYGLHMPQILWDALSIVDPEIRDFNNLDKEHQRRIYRKLGQAFPIYWMPRVQPEKIDFTTLTHYTERVGNVSISNCGSYNYKKVPGTEIEVNVLGGQGNTNYLQFNQIYLINQLCFSIKNRNICVKF